MVQNIKDFFFPFSFPFFCNKRLFFKATTHIIVGIVPDATADIATAAELEGLTQESVTPIPGTPRTPKLVTERFSLMIGVNPRGSLTELRTSNSDLLTAGGHRSLLKAALESNYSRNSIGGGSTPPSPSSSWTSKLYRGASASRQIFLTPQQQRRPGVDSSDSTESTPQQQRRRTHSSASNPDDINSSARQSRSVTPASRTGSAVINAANKSPRPARRSISPLVTPRSSLGDISPRTVRAVSPLARDELAKRSSIGTVVSPLAREVHEENIQMKETKISESSK
jgi:hypothetical protein